jgi:hypothetical protein
MRLQWGGKGLHITSRTASRHATHHIESHLVTGVECDLGISSDGQFLKAHTFRVLSQVGAWVCGQPSAAYCKMHWVCLSSFIWMC